jgi:hypothetical protein
VFSVHSVVKKLRSAIAAEALLMLVRRAAPLPWLRSCRCRRIRCSAAAAFVKTSNVPSVEQSSTNTTSATHGCASTSFRTASTVARSLKTGTITETLGVTGKMRRVACSLGREAPEAK